MKWNHWLIVGVLIFLVFMAVAMELCTSWREEQSLFISRLAEKQEKIDELQTTIYWNSVKQPPSYVMPLRRLWISSPVGHRVNPMGGGGEEQLHKGIDLVASVGTPVRAVLDGEVVEHWLVPGIHHGKKYHGHPIMGAMVIIKHNEGLYSIYGHLSATFVHETNMVEAGQVIGELGNTGISTGPHLHFELVVNPLEYLKEME